jgi:membrane dipeptidase
VRLFGFTHAGNNDFADSSRPSGEPAEEHHGLSPLGLLAVDRLNRLGIIIDISQLTPAGVRQVLAHSKAPVIASHSNVRALVDNARNLSDAELDAIKAHDGLVDVTAFNAYLKPLPPDFAERLKAVRDQFGLTAATKTGTSAIEEGVTALVADKSPAYLTQARALIPRASVTEYVDHIDYLVKRIGIDHVGIGTDFNHGAGIDGFDDESQAPNVTRELVRRGYTEEQIAKIWGGNFLRVFRAVEHVAQKGAKSE